MKIGIACDDWKLPTFEKALGVANIAFTTGKDCDFPGTTFIFVFAKTPEKVIEITNIVTDATITARQTLN